MHNVVALETNPTNGTCCANFKNVVSTTDKGLYRGCGMGWGLHWGTGRPQGRAVRGMGGLGGPKAGACPGVMLGSPLHSC